MYILNKIIVVYHSYQYNNNISSPSHYYYCQAQNLAELSTIILSPPSGRPANRNSFLDLTEAAQIWHTLRYKAPK